MINWSKVLLVPVVVAAAIGLAACGSDSPPAAPAQPDPVAQGGGHDMATMPGMDHSGMSGMNHGGGSGELELWAVQSGPLGIVVTDGSGQLIYRSDRDGNAPSKSNCTGDCTAMWQPVIADLNKPPTLLGVEEDRVGLLTREDGSVQLTLGGWPLYRHIGEHGGLAGTEANGADGVWFAIRPDGAKADPAGSAPGAAPAPAGAPTGG